MKGLLHYRAREGRNTYRKVDLTFCSGEDDYVLSEEGVVELRKRRLRRLLEEAERQDVHLSYRDLELILSTSRSTLKRDMRMLRVG
jgi:hypothetical protein